MDLIMMKNFCKIFFLAGFLLVILNGCSASTEEKILMTGDPPTPEQIVRGFYSEYLEYAASGNLEDYYKNRVYREDRYLSEDFIGKLDRIFSPDEQSSFNPILCSEKIPEKINITGADLEGNNIILKIETGLKEQSLRVVLIPQDQHYLLQDIYCK